MLLLVKSLLALAAGIIVGKYAGQGIVWCIERKLGRHYRISYTTNKQTYVCHVWMKDELFPIFLKQFGTVYDKTNNSST